MQQRQPRLGDILDDYCPRERRLTNHAVVAMVGDAVKQTRCTTCDAEHEYKHAKVPRQRRKGEQPAALYAQVAAAAPKRVVSDEAPPAAIANHFDTDLPDVESEVEMPAPLDTSAADPELAAGPLDEDLGDEDEQPGTPGIEDGPVHRPLIRATLPREGQPPASRPAPEFTIRQPGGRPNRFRRQRGAQGHVFGRNGNVAGGPMRGGITRPGGPSARPARRHGPGKRSK
jgi:hypothetical protein